MMLLFIILNAMKIEINLTELNYGQHMTYFKYTYSDREKIGVWHMEI